MSSSECCTMTLQVVVYVHGCEEWVELPPPTVSLTFASGGIGAGFPVFPTLYHLYMSHRFCSFV